MYHDQMESSKNLRARNEHTLYVEGELDKLIVEVLIPDITVKKLGSSRELLQAANNCRSREYYLIDRDHRSDECVEQIWQFFLDIDKPNLLTLKLKEIENYFLNPDLLGKSEYFIGDIDQLKDEIERIINNNYLTDIANYSIYSIISKRYVRFRDLEIKYPSEISSESRVREEIEKNDILVNYLNEISEINMHSIINLFDNHVKLVNHDKNNFGVFSNNFLKHINGKNVLKEIINEKMFDIKDIYGKKIKIDKCISRIARKIIESNRYFHNDFFELEKQINRRINMYDN